MPARNDQERRGGQGGQNPLGNDGKGADPTGPKKTGRHRVKKGGAKPHLRVTMVGKAQLQVPSIMERGETGELSLARIPTGPDGTVVNMAAHGKNMVAVVGTAPAIQSQFDRFRNRGDRNRVMGAVFVDRPVENDFVAPGLPGAKYSVTGAPLPALRDLVTADQVALGPSVNVAVHASVEDLCTVCSAGGHAEIDCVFVDGDGFWPGCPICETGLHTLDGCSQVLVHNATEKEIFLAHMKRAGRAPARVSREERSWLYLAKKFAPRNNYPRSARFSHQEANKKKAARGKKWWEQHRYGVESPFLPVEDRTSSLVKIRAIPLNLEYTREGGPSPQPKADGDSNAAHGWTRPMEARDEVEAALDEILGRGMPDPMAGPGAQESDAMDTN